MSRIQGDKVNFGNSFVLNAEGKSQLNKEISDAQLIADSIIAEAKKQAASIVAQANTKAEQTVSQAMSTAEASKDEITAESRKQGFDEGYSDGREKILTEMEDLIYNLDNFAKCRFEMKNRIIKSLHTDILDLVLSISEKICKTKITDDKEILEKVVENAISMLKEKETVTIIVNPEMAAKIYAISDDLKEKIHNLEHIKIIEDSSVSPDGTIVESIGSRIDSRVSAQIEQFAHKLFAELNSTPESNLAKELADEEPVDNIKEIAQDYSAKTDYYIEPDDNTQMPQDFNTDRDIN